MNNTDTDLPCTEFGTRMRNITARCANDNYLQNKKTMTNIDNNYQVEAVLARNWFLVLELDAKRIKVGDLLVLNNINYTVTKTNNDVNDGFVSYHFTKTGPVMPLRRRRDSEADSD